MLFNFDDLDLEYGYYIGHNEAKLGQSYYGELSDNQYVWSDINTDAVGVSTLIPGSDGEYYGKNYRIKGMSNPALRITFDSGFGDSYNQLVRPNTKVLCCFNRGKYCKNYSSNGKWRFKFLDL